MKSNERWWEPWFKASLKCIPIINRWHVVKTLVNVVIEVKYKIIIKAAIPGKSYLNPQSSPLRILDIYFSNGEVPFIQSISTGGVVTPPPPEPPDQLAAPPLLHTQGRVVLRTGDTLSWEVASAHLKRWHRGSYFAIYFNMNSWRYCTSPDAEVTLFPTAIGKMGFRVVGASNCICTRAESPVPRVRRMHTRATAAVFIAIEVLRHSMQ